MAGKRVPLEKLPLPKLTKKADDWFSKYVRVRDSELTNGEYVGTCITCTKAGTIAWYDGKKLRFTKGWDAGHFVSRGNKVTRFSDENVNLQCAYRCNNLRSGEYVKYKQALRDKYGETVPEELEKLAEETQYYKLSRDELLQIINDSKESLSWYENQLKI